MTKTEQNRVLAWRLKVLREASAACTSASRALATFSDSSALARAAVIALPGLTSGSLKQFLHVAEHRPQVFHQFCLGDLLHLSRSWRCRLCRNHTNLLAVVR